MDANTVVARVEINITAPQILEVRLVVYSMEDFKIKALNEHLRMNENKWIKKRVHLQFHKEFDDKTDRQRKYGYG